jgi:hypothetical protein
LLPFRICPTDLPLLTTNIQSTTNIAAAKSSQQHLKSNP